MTKWERALGPCFCGRCSKWIPRDERIIVFTFPALAAGRTVRVRKIRCTACAGDAPPDLPAVVERQHPTAGMASVRALARAVPRDWKTRSANEREPGEDG